MLNPAAKKPTIHLFLSMHNADQLSDDKMKAIANRYMHGIGFDEQPYLVYRHHDMPHPHIHIISTSIRQDRTIIKHKRCDMYWSQEVTRQLENEFALIPHHPATKEELHQYEVRHASQVKYGALPLKRAISDVLNTVINHYTYNSLDELNAIFRNYNVKVDRGGENSRLYKNRGLVYCALDNEGRQVSKGIWASLFSLKPTLSYLEKKFILNEALREKQRQRITTAIEWTFVVKPPDWAGFQQAMQREGISVVMLKDIKKRTTEIYYIDYQQKSVFSSKSLGAQYSLETIQERCAPERQLQETESQRYHLKIRL